LHETASRLRASNETHGGVGAGSPPEADVHTGRGVEHAARENVMRQYSLSTEPLIERLPVERDVRSCYLQRRFGAAQHATGEIDRCEEEMLGSRWQNR
jgi:hypothetical protein